MALTIRSGTPRTQGFPGNLSTSAPSDTAVGDVLLAIVGHGGTSTSNITPPSGWTQIASRTGGGGSIRAYIKTATVAGAQAQNWTSVGSGNYLSVVIVAITGAVQSEVQAEPTGNTVFNGSVAAGTASYALPRVRTTAEPTEVFYALAGIANTGTWSAANVTDVAQTRYQYVGRETVGSAGTTPQRAIASSVAQTVSMLMLTFAVAEKGVRRSYPLNDAPALQAQLPQPGGVYRASTGAWQPVAPGDLNTRPSTAYLDGLPNVLSRCKHMENSQTVDAIMCRNHHVSMGSSVDPVFVFANVHGYDDANPNDITVKATLEVPASGASSSYGDGSSAQANSQFYPITFRGARTVTIPAGGYVKSDPLPVELRNQQVYYTRVFVQAPSGGAIPTGGYSHASRYEAIEFGAAGSVTDKCDSGTISGTSATILAYRPQACIATPNNRANPYRFVLTGDSIMAGANDPAAASWAEKALEAMSIPHLNLAKSGEQNVQFYANAGLTNGFKGRTRRGRFISGATDIVSNYSVNDMNSSATFSDMQSRILQAAARAQIRGARFWQTTFTPWTSTTTSFNDPEGQTPRSWAPVRLQINAWLRDGAPRLADGTNLAAGSTNPAAIRAGQPGHPIFAIVDTAAPLTVVNTKGDEVYSPNAYTTDGVHPGQPGHNVMANVLMAAIAARLTVPTI